jgi:hypothetical protein
MKKVNLKIDNLEFRTCNDNLMDDGNPTTGEILQHVDSHCFTIAYWEETKDGFNLRFVGNRPFDNSVNQDTFFTIAKYGQSYLTGTLYG